MLDKYMYLLNMSSSKNKEFIIIIIIIVPEKNIFDWFYHIGAWRPSWSCHQYFSLYLKAFIQSLVQIGTVVSEKIQFKF